MATITPFSADAAPPAIGPYSHGVSAQGTFTFLSGQIPLDQNGAIVGSTVEDQTKQVFVNIKAVLASQGLSLSNVVKTTVFLTTMADFAAMNNVYAAEFGSHKPARSTVAVVELPKQVLVEIEVIACS
ncbi:MAG: deaminase [Chlorobi bacterium]|nr:MAG: deaminase [Bacteroidota bacterium]KXK35593.1 MAG: Enamine/imine deaminase [Chlorobi bacterium OLB6]MBE2264679.1 deaminase [Flavobacteriales bacterium]MBL1161264.1 deaminase [Chlorobiota bacterium]MBW7854300.1 deaminase [Candidatus Kapabacteria bacterium]MCC6332038.1 deaminase [Ignavibacteria bacterium]